MIVDEPQVVTTPVPQQPPAPSPSHCDRVEPVVWLLSLLTILFTAGTVAVAPFASTDGQTFQFLGNLASGFAGALLMKITGNGSSSLPAIIQTAFSVGLVWKLF
jgi:hypothetical protein